MGTANNSCMAHIIILTLILCSVMVLGKLGIIVTVENTNDTYVLKHNVLRRIANRATLINLVNPYPDRPYLLDQLPFFKVISLESFKMYEKGDDIDIPEYQESSKNDLNRIDIQKIDALQGVLYEKIISVGDYMNPSIVKWNEKYLFANSMIWGTFEENRHAKGTLLYKWLDLSVSDRSDTPYLCISSNGHLEKIKYVPSGEYSPFNSLRIEDPRFFVVNDSFIHQTFSVMAPKHITVGTVDLIKDDNNCTYLTNYKQIRYDLEIKKTQKNWSPFMYKSKFYYIQSLNPMVVIDYAGYNVTYRELLFDVMTAVSMVPHNPNITWAFGELRGGTNCILIGNEYFSFFHSVRKSSLGIKTYVMAAYTFSSTPPFRITKISPFPIMFENEFYSGPTHVKLNQWEVDYVLFPTTISLESDEILLSFGHQDYRGYIGRFKLSKVMDSLVAVEWPKRLEPMYRDCHEKLYDIARDPISKKKIVKKSHFYCSHFLPRVIDM